MTEKNTGDDRLSTFVFDLMFIPGPDGMFIMIVNGEDRDLLSATEVNNIDLLAHRWRLGGAMGYLPKGGEA
jgi:hypothetical protein